MVCDDRSAIMMYKHTHRLFTVNSEHTCKRCGPQCQRGSANIINKNVYHVVVIISLLVSLCSSGEIPKHLRTGWSIPSIKLTLFVLIWITYRSHGTATKIDSLVLFAIWPKRPSVNLWNIQKIQKDIKKKKFVPIEEVSYEWMKNEIGCNKTQHGVYQ